MMEEAFSYLEVAEAQFLLSRGWRRLGEDSRMWVPPSGYPGGPEVRNQGWAINSEKYWKRKLASPKPIKRRWYAPWQR